MPIGGTGCPHLDRQRERDNGGEREGGRASGRGRGEPQGGAIRRSGSDHHSIRVRIRQGAQSAH